MQNSPFSGENRLEWLCFDACLMASMEVASILAPHAKYMIASRKPCPGRALTTISWVSQPRQPARG